MELGVGIIKVLKPCLFLLNPKLRGVPRFSNGLVSLEAEFL